MIYQPHLFYHHTLPKFIISMSILFLTMAMFTTFNLSYVMEWEMLTLNSTIISVPIMLDFYSATFSTVVTFISYNVLIFSKSYMANEYNTSRFYTLVLLFIMSMLLFVMVPNLITMILGWDGLGITSFLLVIHYHNPSSLKSGMITVITNRIGDALILVCIALLLNQGSWNMAIYQSPLLSYSSLLVMLAAMTKSAQFPFSAWLPEAMAAPTPVSALVHSSTLVTAGVFLMIRFYPFLSSTWWFNNTIYLISTTTMLMGGHWACSNMDIKKIIALSTLSQLGFMLLSLSVGMVNLCFFHLITHAMFKATLFISAGMTFHMNYHLQTIDNLEIRKTMPLVGLSMFISLLSMNAFFFLAGFYSKDIIFELIISQNARPLPETSNLSFTKMLFISAFSASGTMTAMYSTRIWRGAFFTQMMTRPYSINQDFSKVYNSSLYMNDFQTSSRQPLMLMTIGSTITGAMLMWMFMSTPDLPISDLSIKTSAMTSAILGMLIAFFFCRNTTKMKFPFSVFKQIMNKSSFKSKSLANRELPLLYSITLLKKKKKEKFFGPFLRPPYSISHYFYGHRLHVFKFPHLTMIDKGSTWVSANNLHHYLSLTYHISTLFLQLSSMLLRILDQGLYTHISPKMMSRMTTFAGLSSLKPQISSPMFLVFLVLSLSLIIIII